jgi:uncharacterized membrane protein
MLGVVFTLAATLGFGSAAVFARIGLQHVHSSTATLISVILGSIVSMTIAFSFHWDEIFALSAIAFVWFTLSAFINFVLGRLLNFTSVSLIGVSKATPIVGSSPLFAAALAIAIGGESINLPIAMGTFAIVGGLALILSQR